MSYLFVNNQEIKNDVGNPIPVSRDLVTNSVDNPLYVATTSSSAAGVSAFGEPLAIPVTPVIQVDAIYGIDPSKFQTYSAFSGAIDTDGPIFECSTGSSQYGYGVIRTRRSVRYRSGQGALARFTAAFSPGVAGYTQRAGFFSQESALQVGYDGTRFGILRQNGGKANIYRLTITAAATTNTTVTLTLNGTVYSVPITSGTIQHNAQEIGAFNFGSGWVVTACEDEVIFLSTTVGVMSGTFSVTDDGAQFNSTLTLVQQGVAHTEYWTYQEDFNRDKLNGTGPSGVNLDTTKLNVYQINFRWLGAGEIRFAVENPNNGEMIAFHHIHYAGSSIVPHLDNPSLRIGYVAASLGGSGTNIVVRGASMMGGIEGILSSTLFPDSASATRTSLNSGGTSYHLLSLKNGICLNNKINTKEVILKSISLAANSAASTPIRFLLYKNLSETTLMQWQFVSKTYASATYSTALLSLTNLQEPILQFLVSPGSAQFISMEEYRVAIPPGDTISIIVVGSGVVSQADVVLNWVED